MNLGLPQSGENFVDDMSMHVRQSIMSTLILECQLFVVHAQQLQHRGLQIMHVHRAWSELGRSGRDGIAARIRNVVAIIVRSAVRHSGPNAAAGEPNRKTTRMM